MISKNRNLLTMKLFCITTFLLLTTVVNSQNSTLIQNINYRASELTHYLNTVGDSLILEGSRNISKVEIFNGNFNKTFTVENNKTVIPLGDIPVGRFVTEVELEEKLIIITLLRHNTIVTSAQPLMGLNTKIKIRSDLDIQHPANGNHITAETLNRELNKNTGKVVRFYWIVNTVNMGQSSRKIMKFGNLETVITLIRKHETDHKTKYGQLNDLTIWEIYDTTSFLRYKRMHPNYANTETSDCFNTRPFYNLLGHKNSK
jgi:hypothetical protein